jgi:hypothetical protein
VAPDSINQWGGGWGKPSNTTNSSSWGLRAATAALRDGSPQSIGEITRLRGRLTMAACYTDIDAEEWLILLRRQVGQSIALRDSLHHSQSNTRDNALLAYIPQVDRE